MVKKTVKLRKKAETPLPYHPIEKGPVTLPDGEPIIITDKSRDRDEDVEDDDNLFEDEE